MNLDIGFSNFTIGANANIDLNADRILKTSINALQYPPCLFHMFSDLELLGLDFSIGKILISNPYAFGLIDTTKINLTKLKNKEVLVEKHKAKIIL